jgi:hypothetical protein
MAARGPRDWRGLDVQPPGRGMSSKGPIAASPKRAKPSHTAHQSSDRRTDPTAPTGGDARPTADPSSMAPHLRGTRRRRQYPRRPPDGQRQMPSMQSRSASQSELRAQSLVTSLVVAQ